MNLVKKMGFFALMLVGISAFAQQVESVKPFSVDKAASVTVMPSIASRTTLHPSVEKKGDVQDGRTTRSIVVPGKGSTKDGLVDSRHELENRVPGNPPELVFETALSNSQPTDPSGAVGPNHYFAVFNTGFRIFDKEGNPLTGQLGTNNIFPASGCCDLTVSYDNLADRWVVSFLGNGIQVAVSEGPDPVTTDWVVYNFPQVSDYNKLSVWHDGYYITENTGGNNKLWVLERAAALAGDPNAQMAGFALPGIVTSGFHSPQAFNITDDNHGTGPAPIVYLQDDAWAGVSDDHIKLWLATLDLNDLSNSTVSQPLEIGLSDFTSVFDNGSFANLTQPGGQDIDALQATIMNQAQFRKFSDHNSAVFNFVVDTDPSGGELAGIRWMELRQDNDMAPWTLYQEGTYTAPDARHAWHASMAMDEQGNIGMGFTSMVGPDSEADGSDPNDPIRVSSWYTGRLSSDPLGTMTIDATLIAAGANNIPGAERYGDYGKMDVDPVDNKKFWFINEYVGTSGRANVVGVFQIAPNFADDIGVISIDTPNDGALTDSELVTITIRNFGENPANNFEIMYSVDGGAPVVEIFSNPAPLASGETLVYSFLTNADLSNVGQTYSITASTTYFADEFNDNDSFTKEVTHLNPVDVGVTAINSPNSGSGLSATEEVSITIMNFGSETQTSIPVSYTINGGTAVEETWTGSIAQGETADFTFAGTADLSTLGTYEIVASTNHMADADTSNDSMSKTINNTSCQPTGNCAGFGDGVTELQIADQDISVNCGDDPAGYSDDTDIVFNFDLGDNPFQGVLQMGFDDSVFAIWVDFNDNGIFETEELVANEQVADANQDFDFTIDFADVPDGVLTNGSHLMRVRGEDESTSGDVLDPCDDFAFGRTNDYTANISGSLGIEDEIFGANDLIITSSDQKVFNVNLNTSFDRNLALTVTDVTGKQLVYHNRAPEGNQFNYELDMSYVAAGVYFVRVGNGSTSRVKKILVK